MGNVRSACAKSMAGKRSISRFTSPPDHVAPRCRGFRSANPRHIPGGAWMPEAPHQLAGPLSGVPASRRTVVRQCRNQRERYLSVIQLSSVISGNEIFERSTTVAIGRVDPGDQGRQRSEAATTGERTLEPLARRSRRACRDGGQLRPGVRGREEISSCADHPQETSDYQRDVRPQSCIRPLNAGPLAQTLSADWRGAHSSGGRFACFQAGDIERQRQSTNRVDAAQAQIRVMAVADFGDRRPASLRIICPPG
jgi:hypothetical protein